MKLCERVESRRCERRQPNEVGFVLLGELALEPVGGLDEPVVLAVGTDERDREPASHWRMIVDPVPEVPPLGMGAELLVRQPNWLLTLWASAWMPDPFAGAR
jgi:hypothetical protein